MSDIQILGFNKLVKINKFYYTNLQGGTEFIEIRPAIEVKIVKIWEDYETGIRCWGQILNTQIVEHLKIKRGEPNPGNLDGWIISEKYIVYFSEFDLVKPYAVLVEDYE